MLDSIQDTSTRPIYTPPNPAASLGGELAIALLARSDTGLVAIDPERCVPLANAAALDLLSIDDFRPGEPAARLFARATAIDVSPVALVDWLASGSARSLSLGLGDGRRLAIERAPGPAGHLLLSIKLERGEAVPPVRRDALTGLGDRNWLRHRLDALLADPAAAPALLMIDLDRFKAVNDTRGHPAGDAVLSLVAKRLVGALRATDVVCRFAGDEFAVILPNSTDPHAVAERLVATLSRPYLVGGVAASIGASIGLAIAPAHGSESDELLRAADVALYAVKHGGRGTARLFDAELDRAARQRHALAKALAEAIPLAQFELSFQPQATLDSQELLGFEATLQWRHPEFGLLTPETFLPIAEETGLIWSIGEWVMQAACKAAITWPGDLAVAVDLPSPLLGDPARLACLVEAALDRTGLAPRRLEIELTERALAGAPERWAALAAIRALGIRVTLDEFGTGGASLAQLRRFPFDKLRIDRSFVQAHDGEDDAVIRAIAALGQSLGIHTVLQGTETAGRQQRAPFGSCPEIPPAPRIP